MTESGLALANAGLTSLSGIGGSIASIINTNKTIKANKAMAEYQYSKDLEAWNRQNEYNSPASQMARLKAGGLNPNLMYGSGNVGNASTLPKYQAPKIDYNYQAPNLGSSLEAYQDIKVKQAQIDNINSATRKNEQLTTNLAVDEAIKGINKQIAYINMSKGQLGLNWLPKQLEQKYGMNQSQWKNIETGTELKKSQTAVTDAKTREINRLLGLRADLLDAQVKFTVSNTGLNRYKSGLLMSQMQNIASSIKLRDADILNTKQRTELLKKGNLVFWPNTAIDWWKSYKGVQNQGIGNLTNIMKLGGK